MKTVFSAIRLTLACLLLFSVLYPLAVTGIAQLSPAKGQGETLSLNGRIVGFRNIGQRFTDSIYFYSRPSAVDYNAAGSGGSNKGPSNPDYLKQVQERTDRFLLQHPYLRRQEVPAEMVTASGSGLDPHISETAALVQVRRVAKARNIPEGAVRQLVEENTERPLFGPVIVNVLQLNIQLDKQIKNN